MLPLLRLCLPLSLLLLPWLLAPMLATVDPAVSVLGQRLPPVLSAVALLLACAFKRGRIALAAALSGLTAYTLYQLNRLGIDRASGYVLYTLLGLGVPLLLGWILVQRDTSPLTLRGVLRLGLLLLPFLTILLLWQAPALTAAWLPHLPTALLETASASLQLSSAAGWLTLPPLLLALLLTLVRRTPDEVALLGVVGMQMLAIGTLHLPMFSLLAQGSAALLLILAIIQHIYGLAFIDTLTGIPARRALEHHLAALGRHYSIAMVDIDHFKQFNDSYGHDVGDQVLRMVASQLRRVQAGGVLYRYGGEEFTLVFNHRSEADAQQALEQLRHQIEQYPMRVRAPDRPKRHREGRQARGSADDNGQESVRVTVSIGVAERQADERPETVIKRADEALYRAKGTGRNRVVLASSPTRRRTRPA